MADDPTAARKKYKSEYDDRLNPERKESTPGLYEKRKQLWDALHAYCREQGAQVVSVPGMKVVRLEVAKDSTLPSKLRELGYRPYQCGTTTRIGPAGFKAVDVIEISLPGK